MKSRVVFVFSLVCVGDRACHGALVDVRGQLSLLQWVLELQLGCRACTACTFSAELSCWPPALLLKVARYFGILVVAL